MSSHTSLHVLKKTGDSALTLAATKGHLATIQLLLEHDVHIDQQNGEGNTALIAAIKDGWPEGHWEVAALLIDRDANVSKKNEVEKNGI